MYSLLESYTITLKTFMGDRTNKIETGWDLCKLLIIQLLYAGSDFTK
jgi:hypothetical protein